MKENDMNEIMDFDTYVKGVLGAVLSPDTHIETIKATAVLLRTYMYYMSEDEKMVYSDQLNQPWISARERKIKGVDEEKLEMAIQSTKGSIISYNDQPILPLYFECSNGKTREFSDVWKGSIEYLKSVESVWDKSCPNYCKKFMISKSMWENAWGENGENSGQQSVWQVQIVEKDQAGYVKQVQIGSEIYSGEEVRCRLGLSSACFEFSIEHHKVCFTCYGQGHGVGMSLYGANAMAKEGATWQEIILWYFPGTSV